MVGDEGFGAAVQCLREAAAEGHVDEHAFWAATGDAVGDDPFQSGEDAGDGTTAGGGHDLDPDEFGALCHAVGLAPDDACDVSPVAVVIGSAVDKRC